MRPFSFGGRQGSILEDMRGRLARCVGQGFPDFRGKDRLIRAIYHPERVVGRSFVLDYFGKPYIGNTAEFVDWNVYVYGGAERAAIGELRRLMAAQSGLWTLFDIGANAGTYTLPFADLVAGGFAFEPVFETRTRLAANLAANDIQNISLEPYALGSAAGTAEIYFSSGHSNRGTASLAPYAVGHPINDLHETVTVRTLDSYLTELPRGSAFIVTIDVEGSERDVLARALGLKDHKVLLLIETVDPTVLETLRGWGFDGISIQNDYARLCRYPLGVKFDNHILSNFIDLRD